MSQGNWKPLKTLCLKETVIPKPGKWTAANLMGKVVVVFSQSAILLTFA
jgi:hypothetical protein